MEEFEKAVRILTKIPEQTITGKVKQVNLDNFTCDVVPDDGGAPLFDVRLQAMIDTNDKGIVILPKLNTSVIIAQIGNDDNQWFVVQYTEIDKILVKSPKFSLEANFTDDNNDGGTGVKINIDNKMKINFDKDNLKIDANGTVTFNGGGKGGLVVADSVTTETNKVITRVNSLQTILASFIAAYNAHVPTPVTPMPPITLPLLVASVSSDIQNIKVKH
jgi:hypothetical protein